MTSIILFYSSNSGHICIGAGIISSFSSVPGESRITFNSSIFEAALKEVSNSLHLLLTALLNVVILESTLVPSS